MRSATDAFDANKYWLAEPMLKQCVCEAELFGFNDLRLAKSLSELGRYYTVRGRFEVAQPFIEREFAVYEVNYGKDDGRMVPAMGNLIKYYLNYGTEARAEPLTDDLIAFVEGKIAESHFQNAAKASLEKGALLQGYAGTASPQMRDPLIEWAIICDAIADIYKAKAKYAQSERLYKAALDLKAGILGKGHLSLANSYDRLGALAMDKGEFAEAERYLRDSLATTERTLPPESPEIYGRLDKLAKILIKEGKESEAEELYLRAFSLWKNAASKAGDESRCCYALGSLYCKQKRYAQAASYLSRALKMAEKFSGPNSIVLVPYLEQYAYALYYLGQRGHTNALRARAKFIAGEPDPLPGVRADKSAQGKDKSGKAKTAAGRAAGKGKSGSTYKGRKKRGQRRR